MADRTRNFETVLMNYESLDVTELIKSPVPFHLDKLISHIQRYLIAMDVLNIENGDIVLDASCGHGYGSYMLSQKAHKVIGLDINELYLDKALNVFRKDNIQFRTYDDFFTCPSGMYIDKIVCIETIEHVAKCDMISFINNLIGSLYCGGDMFVAVPLGNNKPHPKNKYHVNEPSLDVICNTLRTYFATIDINIYEKKSFDELSDACYITLKGKKD